MMPTPTIIANGSSNATVAPGASVAISVTNGPGNPTDWVTFALAGSSDTTFLDWNYLSGTHVAPTVGLQSANIHLIAPLTGGSYEARFLAKDGFTVLARSAVSVLSALIKVGNSINPVVPAGTPVAVTVSNGPGNRADWVAFASAGSPDTAFFPGWKYLNDTQTLPSVGSTAATVNILPPNLAGPYEARFLLNDHFTVLARAGFSVQAPPATLVAVQLSSTIVSTSGPNNANQVVGAISVTTNPPGGDTSKVTLSLTGADASKFVLSSPSLPSNVKTGATNIPAGTPSAPIHDSLTINATLP